MDKEYYEVFYNNNNIGDRNDIDYRNADSEALSEKTKAFSQKKEPNETHISQMSVYDFLKLRMETGNWYKLAGMITDKQIVFLVARGDLDDHWPMDAKLSQAIFPNRGYNMGNLYTGGIGVFGAGDHISIDIPNKVSLQQYQVLLDIINQIKKYEKDYDRKVEDFDADALLREAQKKLIISFPIESDEIIVGKIIDEQIIINSLNSELKESIEKCDDYIKLANIARRISNLYEDGFYKKIILKLIPNVEKIYKTNESIRNNGMQEHNDFLNLVSNIDVPLNNQFLQQLLMETKKEKTKPDKNDEVESLMAQVYEGATLKNEEEKRYSKMYEQALKDNEEFDRKKAEEAKQYSEMRDNSQPLVNQQEQQIHNNSENKNSNQEDVNSDEHEVSTLESEQSLFAKIPRAYDVYNLRAVYELVGAGLGLAVTTLLSRRKKVNGDSYIYDVDNLTEKEKEIIDSTYQKLTGENGKHYDYVNKLSKIDYKFNLKHDEKEDYEEAKQEYEEASVSKELIESVIPKSSSEIDKDLEEFETEERRILNSKHFTEEQKKQMIENLYSEFDKYAEDNPELSAKQR